MIMDNESVTDILNDLLAYESRSMLPRLGESTVFFSWASADDQRIVSSMAEEGTEHRAWLVQAIRDLGGEPFPVLADIHSTNLHYLDLSSVLPRTLQDGQHLLTLYESAAAQVGSNARAVSVIARITERLRCHVQQLGKLADQAPLSTP